ncbi:armadillo repeat-containing protein 10 isoform X2 [Neovison vison]|uniref:armadillo repeat-containing protein 10 isoform X2 n=1 Tax=Neovison vison TaxID=452646 RepID=UPI001CF0D320|nr:armadillo repeat-containing protein 10 isoform X2 [Neogale vison]
MGGARDVGWVAAGLVLGAGACYCIYKLTRGQRQGGRRFRLRPSRSAEDLTNGSHDDVLSVDQLQKLLYLLESTDDPVIIERALVTLGNNAAFSANQVIIRELGGIPVIGSKINNPNHSIKEKALNALNNLSVNVENQVKIKVYINQVCKDVLSGPLDSAVQLAGLRLLTNMTVTNDHQHMLRSYITDLFHVLLTGNGSTKEFSLNVVTTVASRATPPTPIHGFTFHGLSSALNHSWDADDPSGFPSEAASHHLSFTPLPFVTWAFYHLTS